MQTKSKQRLVGLLILLAILAIFLPLLFHNSHPSTTQLPVKIPTKPKIDQVSLQTQRDDQKERVVKLPAPQIKKTVQSRKIATVKPRSDTGSKSKKQSTMKSQQAAMSHAKQKEARATTASEQKGLNQFISEPKAWTVQLGTFHIHGVVRKYRIKT